MKTTMTMVLVLASSLGFAQNVISTYAGTGTAGNTGTGGFAQSAQINSPEGLVLDASGNLYIADEQNDLIKKVTPQGIITVYAGGGATLGDGGPATSAKFLSIGGMAVDGSNNLYIADAGDHRIRKITASTGIITTVAGTGTSGYNGDGAVATKQLASPCDVAVDASGTNIYIADQMNHRIRKVNGGNLTTIAGTASLGYNITTTATSARLNYPTGVAVDGSGNVYVADKINQIIRMITPTNTITTIAGTATVSGSSGDGGSATSARLNDPREIVLVGSDLYIDDMSNYKVRKVSSGTITTYAGTGTAGYNGDGILATSANLKVMYGIAGNSSAIFVSEYDGHRVRRISSTCPANAGPNQIHEQPCCGSWPGVQIGSPSVPNMTYAWTPSANISGSTTGAQAIATWSNTVTPKIYTVTVSGSVCTTTTSTVQVTADGYTGDSCCRLANQDDDEKENETINEATEVSIYPNPAKGKITLRSNIQLGEIKVVDIFGKQLISIRETGITETDIDISKLSHGIYFIHTELQGKINIHKLVVE